MIPLHSILCKDEKLSSIQRASDQRLWDLRAFKCLCLTEQNSLHWNCPPPPGYGARAKMEAKLVSNFMEKVGVFHLRTCRVHDFQKKGVFLGDMFSPSEKRGFHFYTRVPYPGPPSKSVHWNFAPPPFPCTQIFAPPSLSHPSPGKFTPTCSLPSLSLSSL